MNPDRFRQVEELYHSVRDAAKEDRTVLLAQADSEVRRHVESLLVNDELSGCLDRPVAPSPEVLWVDDANGDTATVLTAGAQLGPYKIESLLGKGGMGAVYRALDTRLNRSVAIKLCAHRFSDRFEREARAIAALNHPHICSLYDVGPNYLVMELVQGDTLAAVLRRGRLPQQEALRLGIQMASALVEAHARGVIHRDLKPGNIMIAKSGVKVVDFGLAKMPTRADDSLTATHAIIGTPAYMAPEQLHGGVCDARTDIYAAGLVLHEMLTGVSIRPGGPLSCDALSDRLCHVLELCLEADPDRRWQSAADLKLELEWAAKPSAPLKAPVHRRFPQWIPVAVAVLAGVIAASSFFWPRPLPKSQTVRYRIPAPEGFEVVGHGFAISPDGRTLAFLAYGSDNVTRIWAQRLDSFEAKPIPGTEVTGGDPGPFWSPDSRLVAFYSGAKLKKVDLLGGAPQTICDVSGIAMGGSWNRDGVILFGRDTGGLMRVSENGGVAAPVTSVDPARSERVHAYPMFLEDGRHFLYSRVSSVPENAGIYAGSLDDGPSGPRGKLLINTPIGGRLQRSADGKTKLLFQRDATLWAQDLSVSRMELTGEPQRVAEGLGHYLVGAYFDVSTNGALVYRTAVTKLFQLTLLDRAGKPQGSVGAPTALPESAPVLSPDGTKAVMARFTSGSIGLWLYDTVRHVSLPLTTDPHQNRVPVWSPDSQRIAFCSSRNGHFDLFQIGAAGENAVQSLYSSAENKYPTSWSTDGRYLLYDAPGAGTGNDVWMLPLDDSHKRAPIALLRTGANEAAGIVSPDMHWIAYESDESGKREIYVQPFALAQSEMAACEGCYALHGAKTLLSRGGGNRPRWRRDGKELYYLATDGNLMSVTVTDAATFAARDPQILFKTSASEGWDAGREGNRFLFALPIQRAAPQPFQVVLGWQINATK